MALTCATLLAELSVRGVCLTASRDGAMIGCRPADAVTPELAESVKFHKRALLSMLRGEALHTANPFADPRPLVRCDRCGSGGHVDIPIHGGESLRRDCGRCGRFLGWPRWYGRSLKPRVEGK